MHKLVEYAQLIRESRKAIGGFSGVTAKIGTGVLAGLAAISSPFAKIENMNDGYDNTNNVPAIYAEMDAPPRLEQIVEQNLPSGYRISKMADLSENISNILEAVAEGKKLKDKQDEVGELNNALRRLKYSDNK
jgi:HAMP domain-containing protein